MPPSKHTQRMNDEIRRKRNAASEQPGRSDQAATGRTGSGTSAQFDNSGHSSEMEVNRPDQNSVADNRSGMVNPVRQGEEQKGIQQDSETGGKDIVRQYEEVVPPRELTKQEKRSRKWGGRGGGIMHWIMGQKKQSRDETAMLDKSATADTQPSIKIQTEATKPFSHKIALKSGGKLAFISGATIIAILAAIRGFAPQYAVTQTEEQDAQVADAIQQLIDGVQQIVVLIGTLTPIIAMLYGYFMNMWKNKDRPKQ